VGDLRVEDPLHLREENGIAERLGEDADPRARRDDVASFAEREGRSHVDIERIPLPQRRLALPERADELLEGGLVKILLAVEVVMDESRRDARFGRDRGDRRAPLPSEAENARASPARRSARTLGRPMNWLYHQSTGPTLSRMDTALSAATPDRDLRECLGFDCPASLLERLRARYAEPHRCYHTWAHILSCLGARDRLMSATLPAVDLALLFHDAVYDPLASDNEAASAELLVEEGRRAWIDDRILQRARALVLATKHHDGGDDGEAGIVVDADLSILGSEGALFAAYERQVRVEFAAVDDATYGAARACILRAILSRPAIYSTRRGQRLWERSARENLAASLRALAPSRGLVTL
jgi:predicted metal-dependent HD superfamily phosphohydrolase